MEGNIHIVDAAALKAVQLIGGNIVRNYENGEDIKAREGCSGGFVWQGLL